MESVLLAISLFLSSPAGQDPNREPMWFDNCINIQETQVSRDTWIYYCADEDPNELDPFFSAPRWTDEEPQDDWIDEETITEEEEPNEEIEQFSFTKQTKALPKKQKAPTIKAKPVKATKAGTKNKRVNASKLSKSNSKAKPRISFY